jgi:hypothetical protein
MKMTDQQQINKPPAVQVEGAMTKGEYENANGETRWFATVTYGCPLCGKKHRQQVSESGKLPQAIPTRCKKGHGDVEVSPYR